MIFLSYSLNVQLAIELTINWILICNWNGRDCWPQHKKDQTKERKKTNRKRENKFQFRVHYVLSVNDVERKKKEKERKKKEKERKKEEKERKRKRKKGKCEHLSPWPWCEVLVTVFALWPCASLSLSLSLSLFSLSLFSLSLTHTDTHTHNQTKTHML